MADNLYKAPDTSRGAVNTEQSSFFVDFERDFPLSQRIVIDWFQFTLKYEDLESSDKLNINIFEFFKNNISREYSSTNESIARYLFNFFFNVPDNEIIFDNKGLNGYSFNVSYRNIYCYFSDRADMGFNFKLSGQGCRDFEELNLNWNDFFRKISSFNNYNINRIDLALDDFTNDYFTLNKVKDYFRKGLVTSKHQKYMVISELTITDNTYKGNSLQIGSKASRVQIEIYDKLLERKNNNYIVANNIKYWTRTELRFRHETAKDLFIKLDNDIVKIYDLILGVLNNYLCFHKKSPTDSNKSRWPIADWWLKFLGNVPKVQLTTAKYDSSIVRSKKWLEEDTSKSQLKVLISELSDIDFKCDEISFKFIHEMLNDSLKRLNKKDIEMINQYRISNNLSIISIDEINSFIRDIKDIIIHKRDYLM